MRENHSMGDTPITPKITKDSRLGVKVLKNWVIAFNINIEERIKRDLKMGRGEFLTKNCCASLIQLYPVISNETKNMTKVI